MKLNCSLVIFFLHNNQQKQTCIALKKQTTQLQWEIRCKDLKICSNNSHLADLLSNY